MPSSKARSATCRPVHRQSHGVVPLIAKETTPGVDIADDGLVGIHGDVLVLDRDLLQGA